MVVSDTHGAAHVAQLHVAQPALTPHVLPDAAGWEALLRDLPLQLAQLEDEPDFYCAVLLRDGTSARTSC